MDVNCIGIEIYNLKNLINDILIELDNNGENNTLKNMLNYYTVELENKKKNIKNIKNI